jgi:hypothetical protein
MLPATLQFHRHDRIRDQRADRAEAGLHAGGGSGPEGGGPAPEREKNRTWKRFIKAHWESLYACDFLSVEVRGWAEPPATRAVEIAGIHVNPGGEWMKQIARNLTDRVEGFLPTCLLGLKAGGS